MSAGRRERLYRTRATALRRRIWDPAAAVAGRAGRVLIVPDAALHLVDFAALPRDVGGYLVEGDTTLHYLSAERDVATTATGIGTGLLALGAPAFNAVPASPAIAMTAALRSDCVVRPGMRFASLPESGREVATIARLWAAEVDKPIIARGAEASEAFVKAFSPGRRILHLATHAYVLGEGCLPPGGQATGAAAQATLAQSPLLGAGLVLAGATRAGAQRPDGDDGILTAEEIAALDLEGVEWAVLSACDSGLGEVRAGEGVFGLRRAFQIAGVHTVVMSLWPVADAAARHWMEALYVARLRGHQLTADAVRDAGRGMLAAQRQAHASTHPFYWSGFVAAGDWR
jgi:CHAT domain-containing protein